MHGLSVIYSLCAGEDLQPELRVDSESPGFVRLVFAPNVDELWAATTDNKLERYSASDGSLLQVCACCFYVKMCLVNPYYKGLDLQ